MSDPELIPVGPGPQEDAGQAPERIDVPTATDGVDESDAPAVKLDIEITPEEIKTDGEARSGGATVADIEALLFVAERPLSRAELRSTAKLSAEEVDERHTLDAGGKIVEGHVDRSAGRRCGAMRWLELP